MNLLPLSDQGKSFHTFLCYFPVFFSFLDSEVVAPDFMEQVCEVIKVMKPLVHW